ncbi:MAG: 2-succinyl-5-enolpyruvyl-6-hydroxy-3-cyclohexene-1-carboxylic-acid synthase [Anaerolineae bacterium]
MIDATNRTTLWASILADELARHGGTHAVIAPGSRSTPLAVAFSRDERFTVHSALDERGAAFFALGIGMATARPAVLVCTSGTAAANFFPAIIEANQSGVPLLALTADRPADLRGSGANQTIDQVRLYGGHVRWFVELPEPAANPPDRTLRSLRTTICRAVAAATGRSGGPVHINVPLRKPLEPVPVAGDVPAAVLAGIGARGRAAGEPFMAVHTERLAPLDEIELRPLTDAIRGSTRGLIICGRGLVDPGPLVRVAQQTGFPTLVEPFCPTRLSPAATREHQLILGGYETFLRGALAAALKPDLIVRFGDPPVGKALLDYTEQHADVEQIVVTPRTHRLDSALTTPAAIPHEPKAVLLALIDQRVGATVDRAWQAAFVQAEALTQAATAAMHRAHPHEGTVVADVFALAPARAAVFAANSTIIRHVDQFALGGQGQFV